MFPRVVLALDARAQLVRAMHAAVPSEAIGLLGGRADDDGFSVREFVLLPSVAADGANQPDRFTVCPIEFTRAEAALRARGHTWLGFAHSHPTGSAQPSTSDREQLWPGCLHLIVAPGEPEPQFAAFRLRAQQPTPLPLEFA